MLRLKNIKTFPYKLQTVHKLEDNDRRVEMCETLLNHYENNLSILDNIWFNDEAVFHLSGRLKPAQHSNMGNRTSYGNREERDSPTLVVWCTISSKGIIGAYFFVMMPEEPKLSQKKLSGNAPKVFPPRAEK